ncbi:MAG TPA: BatA domain-containing protein [Candidatus Aquilonibacter sp.]|nr:BatA domain-containing protein [Candidatus Aquilonibacter sp.]
MNWTALTFAEVAGLSAAAVAVALWLYLRQPRAARLRVSTLRFWESAPSGSSSARRRQLREPWAFAAQVLFLLLLIAALGNPRWGVLSQGRSVAIVIDAGAWSQMKDANGVSWLDDIRAQANDLLRRLPSDDRILLLRADLYGAPMLPFTTDRAALRAALANLQSSSAVADVPRSLAQARASLDGAAGAQTSANTNSPRGLLVYIGPGLMDEKQSAELNAFRQSLVADAQVPPSSTSAGASADSSLSPEFLLRLVGDTSRLQNIGVTQIALKRTGTEPDEWAVMTQLKNYNDVPAQVTLSLAVGGSVFWQDQLAIAPGQTQNASDDFTSRSGGLLQATITPGDGLMADNRATIVLPTSMPVSVAVVTSRADFAAKMRAVLSANPYVKTDFVRPGANPPSTADVVIYDGSVPPGSSEPATISFVPAPAGAPEHRVRLANWNSDHPVTRWIQSRDVAVRAADSLKAGPDDVVLASSSGQSPEPLILARQTKTQRSVIADFDPLDSNFTEEPAFPLLMAASIEWMTHPVVERGDFLTTGSLDLPLDLSRVVAPSGRDLLFAGDGSDVHFFAGESGLYRITSAGQSLDVPVNVPPLPTIPMIPTAAEAAPLAPQPVPIVQRELWRWLVMLALIALWLEWRFFYFRREKSANATVPAARSGGRLQLDLGERREAEHSASGLKR